ncbi:MFS transporter [Nocardioides nematodiphilus]|uniref:MFS transporter n=1 Tax=Nocardioides nematodiphilus TaxID=2849669 RepID=UPI001CD94183|nr:MFS transporter [Nocardioides nematodiphilus]MCA1981847.1 MFS transporter [Nocardioides nematodiphilus]
MSSLTEAPAPADGVADDSSRLARAARRAPLWLTIAAVSLPMFMATLDNLVMTSALPVIQQDLHSSVSDLSWFMNAYTLAFATFMLPAATLGDRIGRRRMMVAGIVVFTVASIGSALSHSSSTLITARAVQGFGAAAIMPLSLTLLAANVPDRLRPAAIGIWGGVSGLGVALGPVVGGAVVQGISWEAIFWLNVPVAIIALPLILAAVSESRGTWQRLDPIGTLLLGGAVFLGIWGIVHGNDDGWGSATVLVPLITAALLLPAYVAWAARRGNDAVLPLRLFGSRSFSVANLVALGFTLGMFGAVFLLSQYLQVVQGYSPLGAGVRTLPWTAAPMVVAPIAGALAGRIGVRPFLLGGLALQAGSLAWFAWLTEQGSAYSAFIPALAMAGIGMGLVFPSVSTAVLDGLPDGDFAIASSANSTVREFGVALGIALLTAVFLGNGGHIAPDGYDGAIGPALLTGSGAVALAFIAALFAPRTTA